MKMILEIACFIYCAAFLFVAGGAIGYHMAKKESYHKGHAVQCVGKSGYHWECD